MPIPIVPPMPTATPKVTPRMRSSRSLPSELVLARGCSDCMCSAYLIQRRITRAQGPVTPVWTSLFLLYN